MRCLQKNSIFLAMFALATCVLAGPQATAQVKDLIDAAHEGDLSRVRALLAAGADVNSKSEDRGATALTYASSAGHVEMVRALIDAGANLNAKEDNGMTALMWASFAGRAEVVRVLIEAGANLNAKDNHGSTALTLASESGHNDVMQLLTSAGAINCAKPAIARQNGSGSRVVVTVEGKMSAAFGLTDSGFSSAKLLLNLTNWGGKTCSPCDKDTCDLVINAKTQLPPGFASGQSTNVGVCESYIVQGIVSKGAGTIAHDAITAVTIKCK